MTPDDRVDPGPSTTERVRARTARARRALGDPRAAVNVRWLRALSGASVEAILAVLDELESLVPVEEEIHRRHVAGGRANYAHFSAPFELYAFVRLLRPEHVVETGVSSGVSSAHMLLALDRNKAGTLHSVDLPTRQRGGALGPDESPVAIPPGLASGWAVPFRSPRWDLRIGDSAVEVPKLAAELPSVGLFLHDDLHTPERLALELAALRPKFTPGALVLADNTSWTGSAFSDFARTVRAHVYRRGTSDLVGCRLARRRAARPAASGGPTPE
ncbi:hypothetical protein B1B_12604 [mine drainage metagenome]|uniref:Class I SAM-dependent methyltransferase n=1 Tax=mine drainage metagenome TaxID=410659 RepID=T0ZEC7_9ZZZZ